MLIGHYLIRHLIWQDLPSRHRPWGQRNWRHMTIHMKISWRPKRRLHRSARHHWCKLGLKRRHLWWRMPCGRTIGVSLDRTQLKKESFLSFKFFYKFKSFFFDNAVLDHFELKILILLRNMQHFKYKDCLIAAK